MKPQKIITLLLAVAVVAGAVFFGAQRGSADDGKELIAADALYSLGLFSGTGTNADGTPIYDLEAAVPREQAITMIVRILGGDSAAKTGKHTHPFLDVPASNWADPYIGYAYEQKLTAGLSGTAFGFGANVTNQQLITFILRALGYSDAKGDFNYSDCWAFADTIGLTDGDYTASTAGKNARRSDLAVLCYAALFARPTGGVTTLYERAFSGFDLTVPMSDEPTTPNPVSQSVILMATASGTTIYYDGGTAASSNAVIDASNTASGYVMVKFLGGEAKIKVRVTGPSGVVYTYNLNDDGNYEVFPLSDGSGSYTVAIYKNISGTKYVTVYSKTISVALTDEFAPFLRPNQYVNYTADSKAVALAAELTAGRDAVLDKVSIVYNYVIKNISYDREKAATVQSGYLPDIDVILASGKGICFDYSALMTAMLRSQGIPTKLIVGYAGTAYHAWISVYSEKDGWIDSVIYFDGVSWKRMDPTFASSGSSSASIMQYIGDGSNYTDKFLY